MVEEQACDELAAGADSDLVEDRLEVVLDGVGREARRQASIRWPRATAPTPSESVYGLLPRSRRPPRRGAPESRPPGSRSAVVRREVGRARLAEQREAAPCVAAVDQRGTHLVLEPRGTAQLALATAWPSRTPAGRWSAPTLTEREWSSRDAAPSSRADSPTGAGASCSTTRSRPAESARSSPGWSPVSPPESWRRDRRRQCPAA